MSQQDAQNQSRGSTTLTLPPRENLTSNVRHGLTFNTPVPFAETVRRAAFKCILNATPYTSSARNVRHGDMYTDRLQRLLDACIETVITDPKYETLRAQHSEEYGVGRIVPSIDRHGNVAMNVNEKYYGSREISRSSNSRIPSKIDFKRPKYGMYEEPFLRLQLHSQVYGDTLRSNEVGIHGTRGSLLEHVQRTLLGERLTRELAGRDVIYQSLLTGPVPEIDPIVVDVDEYANNRGLGRDATAKRQEINVVFDVVSMKGVTKPNTVTGVTTQSTMTVMNAEFINKHEQQEPKFKTVFAKLEGPAVHKHASKRATPSIDMGVHATEQWAEIDVTTNLKPSLVDFVLFKASIGGNITPGDGAMDSFRRHVNRINIGDTHMANNTSCAEIDSISYSVHQDFAKKNEAEGVSSCVMKFSCASLIAQITLENADGDHVMNEDAMDILMTEYTFFSLARGYSDVVSPLQLYNALRCAYVAKCRVEIKGAILKSELHATPQFMITVMRLGGKDSRVTLRRRPQWVSNPAEVNRNAASVIHGLDKYEAGHRISQHIQMFDMWSGLPTVGITFGDVEGELVFGPSDPGYVYSGMKSLLAYSGWEIEDMVEVERNIRRENKELLLDLYEDIIFLLLATFAKYDKPQKDESTDLCVISNAMIDDTIRIDLLDMRRPMDDVKYALYKMINKSVITGMLDEVYSGKDSEVGIGIELNPQLVLVRWLFSMVSSVIIRQNEKKAIATTIFPPRFMRARNIPLCLSKDGWRIYSATAPVISGLFKEGLIRPAITGILNERRPGFGEEVFANPFTVSMESIKLFGAPIRAPLIKVGEAPSKESVYRVVIQPGLGEMYALDAIIAKAFMQVQPRAEDITAAIIYDPRFAILILRGKGSMETATNLVAVTTSTKNARIIPKTANINQSRLKANRGTANMLKHSVFVDVQDNASYMKAAIELPTETGDVATNVRNSIGNAYNNALFNAFTTDTGRTDSEFALHCREHVIHELLHHHRRDEVSRPATHMDRPSEDVLIARGLREMELRKLMDK